jgi:hypothetical protein
VARPTTTPGRPWLKRDGSAPRRGSRAPFTVTLSILTGINGRYQRIALGPLVIVLIRVVADDRQDFDKAERGLQSPQSHSGHTVTLYSLVRIGTRPG